MSYRKTYLLCVFLLALALAACGKSSQAPSNANSTSDEKPKQSEATEAAAYHFPLTGVKTDHEPEGRAIAAMVNNHPAARPQSGLSEADIVYEVLAEGATTRFLAIFQSELPEKIGPIRSARDYFIHLAEGYNALYVAHGYSPDAKAILDSGVIDHLNGIQYDGTLFKREAFRKAPHNSYITSSSILEGAEAAHYEMEKAPVSLNFLSEKDMEETADLQVHHMKVAYSHSAESDVEYQYDEESGKYSRFTGGVETVEYDTEKRVLLDNLIVIETKHTVIDDEGRRDIDLTSGGKAYVLNRGTMSEVEWKNIDGRVLPYDNGKPVDLVPGKTWISIVPTMDIVSFDE